MKKCGSGDSFERYVWGTVRPVARVAEGRLLPDFFSGELYFCAVKVCPGFIATACAAADCGGESS